MSNLIRLLAVLGVLGALLAPLVAYADLTPPSTTEVEAVRVWRHMLGANDTLMIVYFNAQYGNQSAQPVQDISKTFYFTYGNSTGTILGNETAYPYFNLGYRKGLVAFYWASDDADKPTWGDLGNITMQGTSLFGGSPPSDTLTLTADDWCSSSQPSAQREDIRQWLLNRLIFLEFNWNEWATGQGYTEKYVELVSTIGGEYYVASAQGQAYLGLTIDNITSIVPLLFMTQTSAISHTERDWTLAQQSIFESLHAGDVLGNAQEGLSDLMGGIGAIWASTLVVIMGCIGIVVLCGYWQRLNNGLLIAYAIILLATPEGIFQMGLMALFAMIAVLYLADIVLTKRPQ